MISLTIAEIAKAIGAEISGLDPSAIITEYPVIDSRDAHAGTFFVALPGEKMDGNDFAEAALSAGARFAITTRAVSGPTLVVSNTLEALQALAAFARSHATKCSFIGITGSQGKTTTKELLGHILTTQGETVVPTGSFNNEIGVPLTILRCTDETAYCVLEMGARHQGDIAALCQIARPTIGAVLVVGSAHVGEFGSREKIAQTKGELIDSLPDGGIAVLGSYDEFTPTMGASRSNISRLIFGASAGCAVRAADIEMREGRAHFDLVTKAGRAAVSLRLIGPHQISNALAAAAIATALNVPIETIAAALSTADSSSKWRMELHEVGSYVLINDSYNANPESMAAALQTLRLFAQERGGSSWAFLGKMHELGESERESHAEIGRLADRLGIDHLVGVGTDLYSVATEELTIHRCADRSEAIAIASHISGGDSLLVKASRAEGLDLLANELLELLHIRSETEEENQA